MAGLAKQLREANCRGAGGGSLNKLMQIIKSCNHPYLFADSDVTDEQIVLMSGKIVVLDKMLKDLFAKNHKVLIFSQFTKMLDILEDYFFVRGWEKNVCRIDGSVHFTDRQAQIDGFNDQSSGKNIFLLSTRAGGVGINLASADTVIIFDSDWNPHMDNQAQDRAHRIGQKKTFRISIRCGRISGIEDFGTCKQQAFLGASHDGRNFGGEKLKKKLNPCV